MLYKKFITSRYIIILKLLIFINLLSASIISEKYVKLSKDLYIIIIYINV